MLNFMQEFIQLNNNIGTWLPTVEELKEAIKRVQADRPRIPAGIIVQPEPCLPPGTMVVSMDVWELLKEGKL